MPLNKSESLILFGVAYADVFHFPLRENEIGGYIPAHISKEEIAQGLQSLKRSGSLVEREGFFALYGHEDNIEHRKQNLAATHILRKKADLMVQKLFRFSFIRGAFLTGSVAHKNANSEKDDIDFLLIVKKNRVWITYYFLRLLKKVLKLEQCCTNYILDQSHLELAYPNMFTAMELGHAIPLKGPEAIQTIYSANAWAQKFISFKAIPQNIQFQTKPRILSRLFRTKPIDFLDSLLFRWVTWRSKGHYAPNRGVFKPHSPKRQYMIFKELKEKLRELNITSQLEDLVQHIDQQIKVLAKEIPDWDAEPKADTKPNPCVTLAP